MSRKQQRTDDMGDFKVGKVYQITTGRPDVKTVLTIAKFLGRGEVHCASPKYTNMPLYSFALIAVKESDKDYWYVPQYAVGMYDHDAVLNHVEMSAEDVLDMALEKGWIDGP